MICELVAAVDIFEFEIFEIFDDADVAIFWISGAGVILVVRVFVVQVCVVQVNPKIWNQNFTVKEKS